MEGSVLPGGEDSSQASLQQWELCYRPAFLSHTLQVRLQEE